MRISEHIAALQAVQAVHGDLPLARIDWTTSDEEPHTPLGSYLHVTEFNGDMKDDDPGIPDGALCVVLD